MTDEWREEFQNALALLQAVLDDGGCAAALETQIEEFLAPYDGVLGGPGPVPPTR